MSRREKRLRDLARALGARITFSTAPISERYLLDDPSPVRGFASPPRLSLEDGLEVETGPGVEMLGWRDSQEAYFVGLHELGHVARGHVDSYETTMRDYWGEGGRNITPYEAEAWEWALDHLDEPLEPEVARTAMRWLGDYARNRGNADSRYYSVMGTLGGLAGQSYAHSLAAT